MGMPSSLPRRVALIASLPHLAHVAANEFVLMPSLYEESPGIVDVPECSFSLQQAVLDGNDGEIIRLKLMERLPDCRTYWEYLLPYSLRSNQGAVALSLVLSLDNSSLQLDAIDQHGHTPVMLAAHGGYTSVAYQLLHRGVRMNLVDVEGQTALHLAAPHANTADYFLSQSPFAGSQMWIYNLDGNQPLHIALNQSLPSSSPRLLAESEFISPGLQFLMTVDEQFGYDVARELVLSPTASGNYAVHIAKDPAVYQLMEKYNVSFVVRNGDGLLPIHVAARIASSARVGVLERLRSAMEEEGVPIDAISDSGRTALHFAAEDGLAENCAWLLENGAFPDAPDSAGDVPLTLAFRNGHIDLVDTFAAVSGAAPLSFPVRLGRFDILKTMGETYDALTVDRYTGRSALFDAAEVGDVQMATWFLDREVPLNQLDKQGISVLFIAAEHNRVAVVRLLLERGAPVRQILTNGTTALHAAASAGANLVAELLLEEGATVNSPDMWGRTALHMCKNAPTAELLLNGGAEARVTFDAKLAPLHTAALAGHTEVLDVLLIAQHSDVDKQSRAGNTALHLAAVGGNVDSAQKLLQYCASAEMKNIAGLRPREMDASNPATSDLLSSAERSVTRCQCGCEPLTLAPSYQILEWSSQCRAQVRCSLASSQSNTTWVNCTKRTASAADEGNVTNTIILRSNTTDDSTTYLWRSSVPDLLCGDSSDKVVSSACCLRPLFASFVFAAVALFARSGEAL